MHRVFTPFHLSAQILGTASTLLFAVWLDTMRSLLQGLRQRVQPEAKFPQRPPPKERTIALERRAAIEMGTVAELRERHQVVLMSPLHEERMIEDLAGGIYGFTATWNLRSPWGIPLSYQGDMADLEIHKAKSGVRYVIAFALRSDAEKLFQDPLGFEFTVMAGPDQEFAWPVAIPVARLKIIKTRPMDDGNSAIDFSIR